MATTILTTCAPPRRRSRVDLYLDQQSIDTTTPAGKLMFQVTGAFAEFERSMIRQRVHAGLKRAVIAEFEKLVTAQAGEPNTGFIPMPSTFMTGHEIAPIFMRNNVPAVSFNPQFVRNGGLMSYGNDINDNYRRSSVFVDRILKGEKPSDLPVQMPVKFELFVNLKAAKALGLSIPEQLLATADEVIE
jgi:hypothetical protein